MKKKSVSGATEKFKYPNVMITIMLFTRNKPKKPATIEGYAIVRNCHVSTCANNNGMLCSLTSISVGWSESKEMALCEQYNPVQRFTKLIRGYPKNS